MSAEIVGQLLATITDASPEDVRELLVRGEAQLWLGERSVVLTQIKEGPNGARTMHVWGAAGEMLEVLAILPGGEAWARGLGCTALTINTRRGWARVLRRHGFTGEGCELRKALS